MDYTGKEPHQKRFYFRLNRLETNLKTYTQFTWKNRDFCASDDILTGNTVFDAVFLLVENRTSEIDCAHSRILKTLP